MEGSSPLLRPFNCSSCGAPQTVRAAGYSTTYVCTSCGATFDTTKEPFEFIKQARKCAESFSFDLGQRGELRGEKLEVIGCMIRTDDSGFYAWREYLLFNPYIGFRWLMEMDGHWTLIKTLTSPESLKIDTGYALVNGRYFRLFLAGRAKVAEVLGEFYWQVKQGDTVKVLDYISPPFLFSIEQDSSELVQSIGEYIYPKEIAEAFKIDPSLLPPTSGVSPCQPAPGEHLKTFMTLFTLLFVGALILAQVFFMASKRSEKLLEQPIYLPTTIDPGMSGGVQPVSLSERFLLAHGGNLEITMAAPLNNSWVAFDIGVVDAATQREVSDAALEVSYYSGVDSDGSWTEGSQTSRVVLGDIPAGEYYLTLEGEKDPNSSAMGYNLSVRAHVNYAANFILAFFLLLLPGIVFFGKRALFEKARWENSDLGYEED